MAPGSVPRAAECNIRPDRAPAGSTVETHGDVVKATRSLVFMEGRLYADGELTLRANAVMKAPRELDEYDLSDALPPVYKV